MDRDQFVSCLKEQHIVVQHHVVLENNAYYLDNNKQLQSDSTRNLIQLLYKEYELNYPKFHKMDQLSKLGFLASELVLQGASLRKHDPYLTGLVFQNSSGSLHNDKLYQETVKTHPSPALFVYTLPNIVMGEVAIRHGIKGENTFFISDGIDRKQLAMYSQVLFKDKVVNQLLCAYIDFEEDNQFVEMYWLRNLSIET